jgi:hypothetical protein
MTARLSYRHSGEGRNPVPGATSWIPAFAGMTSKETTRKCNAHRGTTAMMTNTGNRITQGQFSFLPDLTDAQITTQIK